MSLTSSVSLFQVNAVKNEEASQVSKLNDEIKQLRERLDGQQLNVSEMEYVDNDIDRWIDR